MARLQLHHPLLRWLRFSASPTTQLTSELLEHGDALASPLFLSSGIGQTPSIISIVLGLFGLALGHEGVVYNEDAPRLPIFLDNMSTTIDQCLALQS
ncbi:hypothetical protein LIER_33904 [Lithospermum erythrorhizon]|uniref:Uncharacterized protein n=1 Tax=Lithospermum erythrorhizon TaxID=34254 RepID=A0AAV3S2T8_LITER